MPVCSLVRPSPPHLATASSVSADVNADEHLDVIGPRPTSPSGRAKVDPGFWALMAVSVIFGFRTEEGRRTLPGIAGPDG
jgi:hypothetical protein